MNDAIYAVLREAAHIITENGWTQHATARDFAGREVEATSPAATCWCACGAIDKAIEALGCQAIEGLYEAATTLAGGDHELIRLNDAKSATADKIADRLRKASARAVLQGGDHG